MSLSILSLQGREQSGHTVISVYQAEEHHIIQRIVELWNDLGYNGQPMVIWFNLKFKSRARTDPATQEVAQMSFKLLQGQGFRDFTAFPI